MSACIHIGFKVGTGSFCPVSFWLPTNRRVKNSTSYLYPVRVALAAPIVRFRGAQKTCNFWWRYGSQRWWSEVRWRRPRASPARLWGSSVLWKKPSLPRMQNLRKCCYVKAVANPATHLSVVTAWFAQVTPELAAATSSVRRMQLSGRHLACAYVFCLCTEPLSFLICLYSPGSPNHAVTFRQ
jgi:hypothetical protein